MNELSVVGLFRVQGLEWHLLQEYQQELAGLCTGDLRQSLFQGVIHPDPTIRTAQNQLNPLNEIQNGFPPRKRYNASNQVRVSYILNFNMEN